VGDKFPNKMGAMSVINWLKNNQVKAEEIDWLDIQSLTQGKKQVTREEMLDWIKANQIVVKDNLKKGSEGDSQDDIFREKLERLIQVQSDGTYMLENLNGTHADHVKFDHPDDAVDYYMVNDNYNDADFDDETLNDWRSDDRGTAEHESFQSPGEKNDYRELLLTLPSKRGDRMDDYARLMYGKQYSELPISDKRRVDSAFSKTRGQDFNEGHFSEKNVLAHIRFNTRYDFQGKKVLFIEEVQSDWHQSGAQKGYTPTEKNLPDNVTLKRYSESPVPIYHKPRPKWLPSDSFSDDTEAEIKEKYEEVAKEYDWYLEDKDSGLQIGIGSTPQEAIDDAMTTDHGREALGIKSVKALSVPPDAPFKGTGWIKLAMKRMLRYGAENGFDSIAWTTGAQQVDRWSTKLRQNVDAIQWQRGKGFSADQSAYLTKEEIKEAEITHVWLNGIKNGNNQFLATVPLEGTTLINGTEVTLDRLLGKSMANKIRNSKDDKGSFKEDNITVGGGVHTFIYDKAIKDILNKMGKKWGAKVGSSILYTVREKDQVGESEASAGTQPSVEITSEMRESVMQGQPLFQSTGSSVFRKINQRFNIGLGMVFKRYKENLHLANHIREAIMRKDGRYLQINETSDFLTESGLPDLPIIIDESTISEKLDKHEYMGLRITHFSNLPEAILNPVAVFKSNTREKDSFVILTERVVDGKVLVASIAMTQKKGEMKVNKITSFHPRKYENEIGNWIREGKTLNLNVEKAKNLISDTASNKSFEWQSSIKALKGLIPKFQKAEQNKESFVGQMAKVYQELDSPTKSEFLQALKDGGYTKPMVKRASMVYSQIKDMAIPREAPPTQLEKEMSRIEEAYTEQHAEIDSKKKLKARINDQFKLLSRGHRLGASSKAKELTKLKKMITRYARENLPKDEMTRGQITPLLTMVSEAKSMKHVRGAFQHIDAITEKVHRKKVYRAIVGLLKKYKPKKVKGVSQDSKLVADINKQLSVIRDVIGEFESEHKETGVPVTDMVLSEMENIFTAIDESGAEPTGVQSERLFHLKFVGLKQKSTDELLSVYKDLQSLIDMGKTLREIKNEAQSDKRRGIKGQVLDVVSGGQGVLSQEKLRELGLDTKRSHIKNFFAMNQSWEWLLDMVSSLDKNSDPLDSPLNKYFVPLVRNARNKENTHLAELFEEINDVLSNIYGTKKPGELEKILSQNTVVEEVPGAFVEQDGKQIQLEMSQNEAYKKWLEWKDPTLRPTFEKMGYTEETMEAIDQWLNPEVKEWARWQMEDFLPRLYEEINAVFRERFNVDLPFNEFYSPISRDVVDEKEDDPFLQGKGAYASVLNGHLKARVANTNALRYLDGDSMLSQHIVQMVHFIHWTNPMAEMRSILGSSSVQKAIQQFHGGTVKKVLNDQMNDLARGGVDRAGSLKFLDKLRANFTKAVIGINPSVFIKQLTSIPAFSMDIPVKSFVAGLMDFVLAPGKALNILNKSKMMEHRYKMGWERDIILAMQGGKKAVQKKLSGGRKLSDLLLSFTKLGDKSAIVMGGWSVYRYHYRKSIEKGLSEEKAHENAMKQFEASTLRSQQAGGVEDLGAIQRGGSVYKLFTMFMTAPNQYFRHEYGAIRNLVSGRGSKARNLKVIAISHFVLPALFQWVANWFISDDEEKQKRMKRALILGSFNGLLIAGDILEGLLDMAFRTRSAGQALGETPIMSPLTDDIAPAITTISKMIDNEDYNVKDITKVLDESASGISKLVGIPYDPVSRIAKGTYDFASGKDRDIRRILGASPSALYGTSHEKSLLLIRAMKYGDDLTTYLEKLAEYYKGEGKDQEYIDKQQSRDEKNYKIRKEFGFKNEDVNDVIRFNNADKVKRLKKIKEEMGAINFYLFYKKLRKSGVLSDNVHDEAYEGGLISEELYYKLIGGKSSGKSFKSKKMKSKKMKVKAFK
tara:strand:- start:3242 stop:9019 length:5778 start_codon:yes stop_codon:yes gene_type:complete